MNTVAIGDVHGCYTLLKETIKPLIGSQSEVVFLGDLIDRSPEPDGDLKVLRYVNYLERYPHDFGLSKVTVLSGNHEQLLINALEQGVVSDAFDLWEWNGGNPLFYEQAEQYLDWLKARSFYYTKGSVLFVHAGVRPDVPLEDQSPHDLVWIRDPFLNKEDHGLPYFVVHGHTIVPEIEETPYRINIDTGAFYTGNLSAVELTIPS